MKNNDRRRLVLSVGVVLLFVAFAEVALAEGTSCCKKCGCPNGSKDKLVIEIPSPTPLALAMSTKESCESPPKEEGCTSGDDGKGKEGSCGSKSSRSASKSSTVSVESATRSETTADRASFSWPFASA